MRPLPVPPPRQGTELLDRRPGVVAHLFAWLLGSLFVSLYLGGWGFGTAFCGEVFLTLRDSLPVVSSSIGVLAVVSGWSW